MSRRSSDYQSAGRAWWLCVALLSLLTGCSRAHYRVAADRGTYGILAEQSAGTPWEVSPHYTVLPHPMSRFYDPTSIEDPLLPMPAPQLYAYDLPPMPEDIYGTQPGEEQVQEGLALRRLPAVVPEPDFPVVNADFASDGVRPVAFWAEPAAEAGAVPGLPTYDEIPVDERNDLVDELREEAELVIQPVTTTAWEVLPRSCLRRMLEFDRMREEYESTYEQPPPEEYSDSSPRVTLENIIYLASINSREYQSQRETLYRAALRLTLERFEYWLKFSTTSNRVTSDYTHVWTDQVSQSSVTLPATLQVDKVLATGGDILARFANDVVLVYNGPQGFAADLATDAFFDLSQTFFQRDIRFEGLTQAERDVVYAARSYARFRRTLFNQLSSEYYRLIQNYRQVEIDSLGYFQLDRAFEQGKAEYDAGRRSRIQVDQVEQQFLEGRSTLVRTCNRLEQALDDLKIRIGLPTETRLNIDLTELEQVTRRDELAVTGELINRSRQPLLSEIAQEESESSEATEAPAEPNRDVLDSTSTAILDRILEAIELQAKLGQRRVDPQPLRILNGQIRVRLARSRVQSVLEEVRDEQTGGAMSVPVRFQRTMDLLETTDALTKEQYRLTAWVRPEALPELREKLVPLMYAYDLLEVDLEALIEERDVSRLSEFLKRAQALLRVWEQVAQRADVLAGTTPELDPEDEARTEIYPRVMEVLRQSDAMLQTLDQALVPVEIPVDDAMLTALTLRLELMNERGDLADSWRAVKLAADELKSVLNLSATQSLSSRRNINAPIDFTVDNLRTNVRLTFDAPLNRRAQRNAYRQSLINYQAALRNLMQLEDGIKLSVRNDLRSLALGKEQYFIDVASAALAYERVVSTELDLRLGRGASSRDYLEAQRAYIRSLTQVANDRFSYINARTQLFLDLELLTVGEDDFWAGLYQDDLQPTPYYQLPPYALPAYGQLPHGLWYSHRVKRMYDVPTGVSTVGQPPETASGDVAPMTPQDLQAPPPQPTPAP